MNKKFFTLIASAFMLVASLGTVSAVNIATPTAPADAVPKDPVQRFQLAGQTIAGGATYYLLGTNAKGELYASPSGSFSGAFGESLWCAFPNDEALGQNPTFDFTNRVSGMNLLVSVEDTANVVTTPPSFINVGLGNLGGWGFSRTYTSNLQNGNVFYTYFTADSVLVLTLEEQIGTTTAYRVGVKAFSAADLDGGAASKVYSDAKTLKFTLWEPAPVTLTADDYNTLLGELTDPTFVSLTFNKDHSGVPSFKNPWSDFKLRASDSKIGNAGYLNFELKDSADAKTANRWVRVDTSYVNSVGSKFLAFAFGDTASKSNIPNQYEFQAVYHYSNDSLAISVKEARFNLEENPIWADAWVTPSTTDSLNLKLQDLVKADEIRIITIGPKEVNTRVSMGISDCKGGLPNFTSLDEDLYIISRGSGATKQYLAMPIYTDTTATNGVKWVSIDEDVVDPQYLPAFQWWVEKTRKSNPEVSPIRIINREFGNVMNGPGLAALQLTTDGAGQKLQGLTILKTNFAVVNADQKADKYLGYKDITDKEAKVTSYDLNYLHKLNRNTYLGLRSSADSSLWVVEDQKAKFDIVPQGGGKFSTYGYFNATIGKDKKIAQLERRSYRIQNAQRDIVVDAQHRYAVSKYVTPGIFYLKTNNTVKADGAVKQYYALVDTNTVRPEVVKMGISDDALWAYEQVQKETRTSAFAISEYSAPFYRRFDGIGHKNGDKLIAEEYGDASNAPVWLQFTRTNNYPNEVLFENATPTNDYRQGVKDDNISFLGYYNKVQYPELETRSYTFYVDTAFVNRKASGEGTLNPDQYTAKPQYMLALRPQFNVADTIWCQDPHHAGQTHESEDWINCTHTQITIPMVIGDYLFNAQDSVGSNNNKPNKADYIGKVQYGAENKVRLAFVRGVHARDTFYVLRDPKFAGPGVTTEYVKNTISVKDLEKVALADKHYLGENTHYNPRWDGLKPYADYVDAKGVLSDARNGKSMVFQFRLFNGLEDRTFTIESRNDYDPADKNEQIGPDKGEWLQYLNGVPVISQYIDYKAANTIRGGADPFDVVDGKENNAVGNENAPAVGTEVKVISEAGAVTILNAAGKNIAISNILGQTVANQTLNSNSATIALPKGIVVVSVEGEKAVKAIVK